MLENVLIIFFFVVIGVVVLHAFMISWWRTLNYDKAWRYRRRMGYWCDHRRNEADSARYLPVSGQEHVAWGQWYPLFGSPDTQYRQCGRCGWEQRRELSIGQVRG
jgi:hypothetical protein